MKGQSFKDKPKIKQLGQEYMPATERALLFSFMKSNGKQKGLSPDLIVYVSLLRAGQHENIAEESEVEVV